MILEGTAHVFPDHVSTDYIISSKIKSRIVDFVSIHEQVNKHTTRPSQK